MRTLKTFNEKYRGKRYGKMLILEASFEPNERKDHVLFVLAKCEHCGRKKVMLLNNIVYGFSKSCGCIGALKAKRRSGKVKLYVKTPDGPKTIPELADERGVSYQLIYYRMRYLGVTDAEEMSAERRKRKPLVRREDVRLNGKSQKEVCAMFSLSRQAVSYRLKIGWVLNEKDEWVSPVKGVVGDKVFRVSPEVERERKKRRYMDKLFK